MTEGQDVSQKKGRKYKKAKLPASMKGAYFPPMANPMLELDEDSKRALEEELAEEKGLPIDTARGKLEKVVDQELDYLSQMRFPLPASMSMLQWRRLLRLESKLFRYQYLDELARRMEEGQEHDGPEEDDHFYEELVFKDQQHAQSNIVTPEAFAIDSYLEEIAMEGISTSEAIKRLSLASRVASLMVSAKRWLPPLPPLRQRDRRELIRESTSEKGAFKVLHYLAKNYMKSEVGSYVAKRAQAVRVQMRSEMREAKRKQLEEEGGGLFYGAFYNSIVLRVNNCRMEK